MFKLTTRGGPELLAALVDLRLRMGEAFRDPAPIQDIVAAGVLEQMDRECDPDGKPWPDLSDGYATWKATVAPGSPMGLLTGPLKAIENIRGLATTSGDRMTITYGGDQVAIYHARCFTEGGASTGTSQPPRPFWAITARAEADLCDHVDATMNP